MRVIISTISLLVIGIILLMMVAEMPEFGSPSNPSNNIVSQRFTEEVVEDTNVKNIVSAIITDYRAYDTIGETTVLFTGIAAVLTVLGAHIKAGQNKGSEENE
ncbi:hydrogen gas-evolving membrane-bound hydrogenase subunit E [Anaerobranca gottschalkii]|uniref:Multicomponent Na+:H+ antiporter subunit B n=1 Tax=Anaerobranca gottschalkii DSM 13577 TaxID=1120990 RepID=A0A1H9YBB4_9FIRM|nr:hydrogen gas-evolving membrane-bound hydrogenase subunit E [Anaerobranca gottschalkii]SES65759.1 multicomponent Na+:H+ antiporter subunit B [Anaerobranca gottschalkii DSM 13577]